MSEFPLFDLTGEEADALRAARAAIADLESPFFLCYTSAVLACPTLRDKIRRAVGGHSMSIETWLVTHGYTWSTVPYPDERSRRAAWIDALLAKHEETP